MIKKLKEYDLLYYTDGTSPISDEEYDYLKEQAKEEYPNDPYFKTVGSPSKDKIKLPYVLGSLNKLKPDTVDGWIEKHPGEILASQKLDGVSILVIYRDGEVEFASTRGDGEYGRDITDKAKIFCEPIENKSLMVVRGEALLVGGSHLDLGFKTARNGVAGMLNRDELNDVELIFPFFYELIEYAELKTYTEYERFVLIESLGLRTPEWVLMEEFDIKEVMSMISSKGDWDVDGVVLTVNNSEREDVKYPKNKIAFKVQGESVETKVLSVEWNVGRTGRIIPVVIFETIEIGGVKINRTTGFNAKFILDNSIVSGVTVKITRSGDVIPYLTSVENNTSKKKDVPDYCPSCDTKVEWKGVDIVCTNKNCHSRTLKSVEYFLRALGAENITSITLEKLGVHYIEEVYDLNEFEISEIDGFGIRSGEMIVDEITKTLTTTQEKLLQSFAIPGVGRRMSKTLLGCFGTIENIFESGIDELTECESVGPKIAGNIVMNIYRCENLYKYLTEQIGMKFEKEGDNNMLLKGQQFTLTGKGDIGRKEIISLIEDQGGTVKGMSKTTNYLVTNDVDSQSGKTKKAREYGTQIISYDDLMGIL